MRLNLPSKLRDMSSMKIQQISRPCLLFFISAMMCAAQITGSLAQEKGKVGPAPTQPSVPAKLPDTNEPEAVDEQAAKANQKKSAAATDNSAKSGAKGVTKGEGPEKKDDPVKVALEKVRTWS